MLFSEFCLKTKDVPFSVGAASVSPIGMGEEGIDIWYGVGAIISPTSVPEEVMIAKIEEGEELKEGIDFQIKEIMCFELSIIVWDKAINIDMLKYINSKRVREIYSKLIAECVTNNLKNFGTYY